MRGFLARIKSNFIKFRTRLSNSNKVKFGKRVLVNSGFVCTTLGGGNIIIGEDVFFNNNCSIHSRCKVIIGDNCLFGEGVKIYDHNHIHNLDGTLFRNQGFKSREVVIGKNVWIASNVIILQGVSIGDNCVIGAGCIIHTNVPSNSVVINNQDLIIKVKGNAN